LRDIPTALPPAAPADPAVVASILPSPYPPPPASAALNRRRDAGRATRDPRRGALRADPPLPRTLAAGLPPVRQAGPSSADAPRSLLAHSTHHHRRLPSPWRPTTTPPLPGSLSNSSVGHFRRAGPGQFWRASKSQPRHRPSPSTLASRVLGATCARSGSHRRQGAPGVGSFAGAAWLFGPPRRGPHIVIFMSLGPAPVVCDAALDSRLRYRLRQRRPDGDRLHTTNTSR
jgi:hypothetical protein